MSGNDDGKGRMGMRDWLADAQRRIRRHSLPNTPSLGVVARSRPTPGVTMYRRAVGIIGRLPLAKGLSRVPLVLRQRARLTAARGPTFTIQSHPVERLAEASAGAPPPSSAEPPTGEEHLAAALETGPAPSAGASLVSSVTRVLRRLVKRTEAQPSEPEPMRESGPPAGSREDSSIEGAAASVEKKEGLTAAVAESDVAEAIAADEEVTEEQGPGPEESAPTETAPAPSTLVVRTFREREPDRAMPEAVTPEAEQARRAAQAHFDGPHRPAAGTQAGEGSSPTPPVPLIARLARTIGSLRRQASPVEPPAGPTVAAEARRAEDVVPAGAQGRPPGGKPTSGPVPTDQETVEATTEGATTEGMTTESITTERVSSEAVAPAPRPGGLAFLRRVAGRGRPTMPTDQETVEATTEGATTEGMTTESITTERVSSEAVASAPRPGGLAFLRRVARRGRPTPPPQIGAAVSSVQRQPAEDEVPSDRFSGEGDTAVGGMEAARQQRLQEPGLQETHARELGPPESGPQQPAPGTGTLASQPRGLLLTLRRLIRFEQVPAAPPGPAIAAAAGRERPEAEETVDRSSGEGDMAVGEAGHSARRPPPVEAEPAPTPAPTASRPGGFLPVLRRLARRGPPPVTVPAPAAAPSEGQPRETESARFTPETPAFLDAGAPLARAPSPASRYGELQVGPWAPIYRSLAVRRFAEEGGARGAAWAGGAPAQQRAAVAATTVDRMERGQIAAPPALPADRKAEEGFALSRETGGVIAIERETDKIPRAATDDARAEENAPRSPALEKVARQVYELIRRRLQVERERAGLGSPWL